MFTLFWDSKEQTIKMQYPFSLLNKCLETDVDWEESKETFLTNMFSLIALNQSMPTTQTLDFSESKFQDLLHTYT